MRPLSPELMAIHRVKSLLRDPKDWYHPEHGRIGLCLGHAILNACYEDTAAVRSHVTMAFRDHTPFGFVPWNDKPGRTHAEVMELCERVITAEECRWAKKMPE